MEEEKFNKAVDLLLSFNKNLESMFNNIGEENKYTDKSIGDLKELQGLIISCCDLTAKEISEEEDFLDE